MNYLDENGLQHYNTKIKFEMDTKVEKVDGKGLSSNDYTTEEKTKLSGLSNYDDTIIKADISALNTKVTTFATDEDIDNIFK